MLTLPRYRILHTGNTELVGIDEQVDQNEFGAEVAITLSHITGVPVSGEFLSLMLYLSCTTRALEGELLIFTAAPGLTAGDPGTGITAAEWATCIGRVKIVASDWTVEDLGAIAYISDQPVPFHDVCTLYFLWRHTDAVSLNASAGDDESLDVDAWYVRYS